MFMLREQGRFLCGLEKLWGRDMHGVRGSWPYSLTLKKNRQVCVTPEAPWIQLLIHKLMQR
ncbi:hypothetical protein EK904_010718 [Melospiza melodia maxima]|nr:hypothetical protein EK904_010718 [Melospiza melodia maxima]